MVSALLAGTKTQTRRLASSPLSRVEVGDRLYVREHWRTSLGFDTMAPKSLPRDASIQCIADGTVPTRAFAKAFGKDRRAMHMPRWASRLTLIVTDKRFQPLQSIDHDDAKAEGVVWSEPTSEDETWALEYAEEYGVDAPPLEGVWTVAGVIGQALHGPSEDAVGFFIDGPVILARLVGQAIGGEVDHEFSEESVIQRARPM